MNVEAAAEYAERHALHALLVQRGEEIVFERYGGGAEPFTADIKALIAAG